MLRVIDRASGPRRATARLLQRSTPGLYERMRHAHMTCADRRARPLIRQLLEKYRGGWFDRVELETMTGCNQSCSFCPVNRHDNPRPALVMTDALFDRILDMLAAADFRGNLSLFSNNEPLLDPRLEELTSRARRVLPQATHSLHTNGTLLTVERFARLMPSLDLLVINNYQHGGGLHPTVRAVCDHIRAQPCRGTVSVFIRRDDMPLGTRAGTARNRAAITPLSSSCFLPYSQLVIRPDGKISQCCEDALGRVTLGDLSCQSLAEAWPSPARRALQERIRDGRAADPLCRCCDTLDTDQPD